MPPYGIGVTLIAGFTDTVENTRAALAEQGFGIFNRDRCRRHHESRTT